MRKPIASALLLVVHAAATWLLTGLIWIVQLVQILVAVAIILCENAEDRCGVGFPVNSTWTGVSRS